MPDEYIKELCKEKHRNITEDIVEVKSDITNVATQMRESTNAFHKKLNGFYVLAIATLAGVLGNILALFVITFFIKKG